MQYNEVEANELMNDLRNNPSLFREKKKTYKLLQHFFFGFPLSHLHTLLVSSNEIILKVAFSIAFELADGVVVEFLDEAIVHHNHPDRWIRHCADAIIARATTSHRPEEFFRVLEHLEDADQAVMGDALSLFINGSIPKLEGALSHFENVASQSAEIHIRGLRKAIEKPLVDLEPLINMIGSKQRLETLYGIGIAIRNRAEVTRSIDLLDKIEDSDLYNIAKKLSNIRRSRRLSNQLK